MNNTTALADGDKIAMTSRTALGLVRHLDFEHGRGWLRDRVREAEQREAGAGACCDEARLRGVRREAVDLQGLAGTDREHTGREERCGG